MRQVNGRDSHLMMALEPRWMFDGAVVAATVKSMVDAVPPAVEVRAADSAKDSGKKEVAFVDTSLAGYQALEAGIRAGVAVVEIGGGNDGLAQIAQWAETHGGYDAIHILSHGTEGQVDLGTTRLNDAALADATVRGELAMVGQSLKAGGDLLVYGCDVAKGADGQTFITDLAAATGVDVAASTDATGAAAKGGNWTLEAGVGTIDAEVFAFIDWNAVLGFSSSDVSSATNSVAGTIDSASDPANSERAGTYWDTYYLTGVADAATVQIYIAGGTLTDPYVQVLNAEGAEVAFNDDGGTLRNLDSYVSYTYHTGDGIGATAYSSGQYGTYTIYVSAGTLNAYDPPVFTSTAVTIAVTDPSALNNDTFSASTGTITAHSFGYVDTDGTKTFGVTNSSGSAWGTTVAGSYGSLSINSASGAYSYTPNATAVNALVGTASDSFWVTVRNSHITVRQLFTVNVTGDHAPVGVADTATATEAGGTANGTAGSNPTGNVLTNDTDVDASDTKTVSAITGGTVGVAKAGSYGSLTLNADGSYSYAVDNSNGSVQALRSAADTLTDSFTYTVRDTAGATSSTTLTVTIQGANDAPVAVADTALATEAGGVANGTAGSNPTGNVLTNDTDVDNGDTKAVSAIAGGTLGSAKAGSYGSLTLNADGSYSYAVDNSNTAVQALRTTAQTLTDSFTYTMRDTAGLTSSTTLTVTIRGANDAPAVAAPQSDITEQHLLGWSWQYVMPAGTFTDVDTVANGETATYSTTLVGGAPLPGWLRFDAATRTFSGTPPLGVSSLDIRMTVTDAAGASAYDDIHVTLDIRVPETAKVAPPPPEPPKPLPKPPVVNPISDPVIIKAGAVEGGTPIIAALRGDGKPAGMQTVVRDAAVGEAKAGDSLAETATSRPAEAIVVAKSIGEVVQTGQVSFAVPADAFATAGADGKVTLRATRSDGSPLPSWLSFNPATGRLEGVLPPGQAGDIEVRISARDGAGAEASQVFKLTVKPRQGADAGPITNGSRHAFAGKAGLAEQLRAAKGDASRFTALVSATRAA